MDGTGGDASREIRLHWQVQETASIKEHGYLRARHDNPRGERFHIPNPTVEVSTTLWVGHHRMSPVQRRQNGTGCHMQSPRRRQTGETIFRVFGSVVEVVSECLVCRAWVPTFPTPVGLDDTQSTE